METQDQASKRPVFLTVICIISFVGLGVIMFKSLFAFAFGQLLDAVHPMVEDGFDEAITQMRMSDPQMVPFVESIFDAVIRLLSSIPLLAALNFVISGVALAGVILMWNLKKSGFFMFAAAKVIGIFVPMMVIGVNFLSMMMSSGIFMVSAVFITLYAINLKAMN